MAAYIVLMVRLACMAELQQLINCNIHYMKMSVEFKGECQSVILKE